MSNRRRRRRRVDIDVASRAAIMGAKLEGCTCEPLLKYPSHPAYGTISHVFVAHADDCPLVNKGLGAPIVIRRVDDA